MTKSLLFLSFIFGMILFSSCGEDAQGPNEIGGTTDLELTKEGNSVGLGIAVDGASSWELNTIKDSIWVAKSENGIVTMKANLILDSAQVAAGDSLFGTQSLPWSIKIPIIQKYLTNFGGTMDTTNKQAIKVNFEIKGKVTSEGIQDFMYSGGDMSKPYTIMKYNCNVGDKYEFTKKDGTKAVRTVTVKSTKDDWPLGFYMVKTIQVEELQDDPIVEKITYIGNHKFGLIGVVMKFKTGKLINLSFMPWAVL